MKKIDWALAAAVALIPFVSSGWFFYGSINTKFFFIVAVVNLCALWFGYRLLRGVAAISVRRRWLLLALILMLGAHYASAYFGVFPEKSLWSDILRSSGVLYLTHIALFAVLLGEMIGEAGWSLIRRAVVFSSGALGIMSIVGRYGFGLIDEQVWWIPFGSEGLTFGNSTFAGVYLLLAFAVGLIELARSYGQVRMRRMLMAALAAIALSPIMFNIGLLFGKTSLHELTANPTLLLGAARASSATMFLILLFLFGRYAIGLFSPDALRKYLLPAWGLALLIGVFGAVGLLFTPGSVVQDAYIDTSTEARILVWQGGLTAVTDRPYLGWGPENYNDAHEKHFDNRLYLQENIGEVWFDRAHNIIVDTLVSVGVVGATAIVLFILVFVRVVRRAYTRGVIGATEAVLLAALPPAHFLQLQTGFDTVPSYALWGVIVGYVLYLERRAASDAPDLHLVTEGTMRKWAAPIGGALLIALALVSIKFVLFDEFVRQRALVKTFETSDAQAQRANLEASLTRTSDWEALRLSSSSFLKGAVEGARHTDDVEGYISNVLETAKLYEKKYAEYEDAHPDYYRVRMNHAYLLLIETGLGERRLEEARDLVEGSYALSPNNPLTPAMNALVYLYGINFKRARELADEAIAINPDIEFTQQIDAYIETQIQRFPKNTILQLGNL